MNLAKYRKFLVALAGVLGQVVALGLVHGVALHWTQVALSALTALGVVATPNAADDSEQDWTAADAPPTAPQPYQPEHAREQ